MVAERQEYFPPEEVIDEVREVLDRRPAPHIDWITFAGSGEPLLHTGIGRMISGVKALTNIPMAMLTNGSLFHDAEIRRSMLPLDAVMPSIDAGSDEVYRRINRPHPGFTYETHVEGLVAFAREYEGKLWPEVMIIRGVNDGEDALADIAAVLERLAPDVVHINVPTRPPAETWVEPPDAEGLMRAAAVLGKSARIVVPGELEFDADRFDSIAEAVIEIVSRHPMRIEEIRKMLRRWPSPEVDRALLDVEASGRVQVIERLGARFLAPAGSRFSPRR